MHHSSRNRQRIWNALWLRGLCTLALLTGLWLVASHSSRALAVGEPVTRIQCPSGYQATLYADALTAPDGLAFDPSGVLHVAEETAGRVSRVNSDGSTSPVLESISSPEGIAFDPDGNLYVVEDVENGRLLRRAPNGTVTTLAANLDAPEGVVWTTGGTLYVTESNVQFSGDDVFSFETRVTAVTGVNQTANVRTDTIQWSYAGITVGADGQIYVTNEAAPIGSDQGVFTIDPATGERVLLASGLTAPEGLRFAVDGQFPLYVAEEGTNDSGRLSQVTANGDVTSFCTGFLSIEDVVLDSAGRIYVSEDGSGSIILITPPAAEATATPTATTAATATPPIDAPTATATTTATPEAPTPGSLLRLPLLLR